MADELKINGSVTDQATMVELRDVHKSFGDHEVLKGINVSIRRGEVVAISDRPVAASRPCCAVSTFSNR